jgi:hypothetical protein
MENAMKHHAGAYFNEGHLAGIMQRTRLRMRVHL